MNDPYGLLASGLPPDMAAEAMGLSRQQAVMQALLQQAQQTPQVPEAKGRFTARISPLAPISQALLAYAAQRGMEGNDKKFADLSSRRQTAVADALTRYQQTRDGSPGGAMPNLVPNDDEGNALPTVAGPGVPGDRRAAVTQALVNPLIANSPLVTTDLKAIQKEAEPFSLRPGQQRYVGKDVVASAPLAPVKVTATDATGAPVDKFVTPDVNAPPIAQPVKMEMKDTGKTIEPTNPYTQKTPLTKTTTPDADLHASVTTRGQNMTDARTRELNGILQNGGSNDQIESMAQMIANGQLAPPSGYALRNPMMVRILGRAKEINPDFNAIDYHVAEKAAKDFATGKPGNSVRSFNVALSHLDTLGNLATALDNGDTQLVNKVANAYATQTGAAAPVNFEAAKKIVGDEIVKAIVGSGGGVADREEAAKTISAASSPKQLAGVIGTYKELMRGQLGGLRQQYEQSTGRKDFDRFLSEAGKAQAHGNAPAASGVTVLKFDAQGNQQ
jgi:hypothetical protein